MAEADPHRIVIVGGGAGGLELATRLGDTLGKGARAEITLIDRNRTHIWKPLLHAIAAGSLRRSQHELNYLAQAHWHHFKFRHGEMVGLDREARQVRLGALIDDEGGEICPPSTVGYDTLILAVGSITNDFGTPGAAEFAVPLETPDQASRFNRKLVNACVKAQHQTAPISPGQLHVAIIGAGATGTELAAELHHTAREIVAYGMDKIDPEHDLKIVLIEAADRILPALPPRISNATRRLLEEIGVEVRVGARVSEVRRDGVALTGGEFIPSDLVVWAAGVKGPAFLSNLDGLEANRINQLVVRPSLQTTRDDHVFVIGDCASCTLPGRAQPIPPRAQSAHQMSEFLLKQIEARLAGRPLGEFVYQDFGSLVSLGAYSTVGSLMGALVGKGMFIEGYFARLMYRSLYKMHEAALHGRVRTLLGLVAPGARPRPTVKLH